MEKLIHDTFDKVTVDKKKKAEIRETLNEKQSVKRGMPLGLRLAAAAAALMGLVMCVPQSRNAVLAAASYIKETYFTADGGVVEYEKNDNEMSFTISYDADKSYTEIADGRLYFVLGNEKLDVTDQCSETKYYRHEIKNADGSKSVIFVGGTVENSGWVELLFDADGNYVFNQMQVEGNGTWADEAMHNEGVPTGNPEYDFK